MRSLVILCGISLVASILVGACQRASGQEPDPRIKQILADWKKRQEATSVILIRASGTRVIAKGGFATREQLRNKNELPENPPREMTCELSRLLLLDLARGRYRFESQSPIYDTKTVKFYPHFSARTFDGKSTATYRPREKNTHPTQGVKNGQPEIATTIEGFLGGATFELTHCPLFFGLGIVPTSMEYVSATNLKPLPDGELLTFHANALHRQNPCVVLRSRVRPLGFFDELWIDTAKDSAIVRMVLYADNSPQKEYDIEYKKTPNGWLAASWTYTRRHPIDRSKLSEFEQMKVDDIVFEPEITNDRFVIEPKPGQLVKEFVRVAPLAGGKIGAKPAYKVFEIKADGTRLLVDSSGGSQQASNRALLWLGALGLLPSVFGLLWFRRRKSANLRQTQHA